MARPALIILLHPYVISLLLLMGCSATPWHSTRATSRRDDLPPATRPVDGVVVLVEDDRRSAVQRLVTDWREALEHHDVQRLRALLAPTLGGIQQPGPGVSREAWLTHSEAIFASGARGRAWLEASPTLVDYDRCAPRCPSGLLAPGEWQVRWQGGLAGHGMPGLPSERVLPSTLRVAVDEGVASVVGIDDDIAAALGPSQVRLSGLGRP